MKSAIVIILPAVLLPTLPYLGSLVAAAAAAVFQLPTASGSAFFIKKASTPDKKNRVAPLHSKLFPNFSYQMKKTPNPGFS